LADINLRVQIFERDSEHAEAIANAFRSRPLVESAHTATSLAARFKTFDQNRINAILINIFTFGAPSALDFIASVREDRPEIPIAIAGTARELSTLPDVPPSWRLRLGHYFRLTTDSASPEVEVDRLILSFASWIRRYALTDKLTGLQEDVEHGRFSAFPEDKKKQVISEIVTAAKVELSPRQQLRAEVTIVPGFGGEDLTPFVKSSLERVVAAVKKSTTINIAVLVFGIVLVSASFVIAYINDSWKFVGFGGFGLAGIITALITGPLRSVDRTARGLVHVQVAFLSFLNQLELLRVATPLDKATTAIEASKQLATATNQIMTSLEVTDRGSSGVLRKRPTSNAPKAKAKARPSRARADSGNKQ
jgi:hypothetical protein